MSKKETVQLTDAQIEDKAAELGEKYNCKVIPLMFYDDQVEPMEQVVGYMKAPQRIVKMRALDKSMQSPSFAGAELLEACLLKDDSDPRIYSQKEEHDHIYIGACVAALQKVKASVEQLKKN